MKENILTIRIVNGHVPNLLIGTLDNSKIHISGSDFEIIGTPITPGNGVGRYAPIAVNYNGVLRSIPSLDPYRQEPTLGIFIITKGGVESHDILIKCQNPYIYSMTMPFFTVIRSEKLIPLTEPEARDILLI